MSDSFVFEDWCKASKFPQGTITLLQDEHFTEFELLTDIDFSWIGEQKIPEGEKVRLRIAIENLLKQSPEYKPTSTAGIAVKIEPGSIPEPHGGIAEAAGGTDPVVFPTTSTLAKHQETKAILESLLSNSDQLAGFRDLLALGSLQAGQAPVPRGEKAEKPLLIKDFLRSSINRHFSNETNEVSLNSTTKIVVEGKGPKKPEVSEYTTELWAAANLRSILYLLRNGTPAKVVEQYVEYSSWVADYLDIYNKKGVFLLDEQHRLRVASENRLWNDLYTHDVNYYLTKKSPFEYQATKSSESSKKSKSGGSKRSSGFKPRKQVDTNGTPLCFNYNSKKGCEDAENCQYSHLCNNPGCLGSHSSQECGRVGPRLQRK